MEVNSTEPSPSVRVPWVISKTTKRTTLCMLSVVMLNVMVTVTATSISLVQKYLAKLKTLAYYSKTVVKHSVIRENVAEPD
jgi:hypothetical protein